MTMDKTSPGQLFSTLSTLPDDFQKDKKCIKIGVHTVSNIPLQVSLYFNLIFFPFWLITYANMVPTKFHDLSMLYQVITCLAFSAAIIIEIMRLYIGYKGNLQEKIEELAGFWLTTILLQTPLQMFLLFSSGLKPSLLETIIQTVMCLFLISQLCFGIVSLRNVAKQSVIAFHLTGVSHETVHEGTYTPKF